MQKRWLGVAIFAIFLISITGSSVAHADALGYWTEGDKWVGERFTLVVLVRNQISGGGTWYQVSLSVTEVNQKVLILNPQDTWIGALSWGAEVKASYYCDAVREGVASFWITLTFLISETDTIPNNIGMQASIQISEKPSIIGPTELLFLGAVGAVIVGVLVIRKRKRKKQV